MSGLLMMRDIKHQETFIIHQTESSRSQLKRLKKNVTLSKCFCLDHSEVAQLAFLKSAEAVGSLTLTVPPSRQLLKAIWNTTHSELDLPIGLTVVMYLQAEEVIYLSCKVNSHTLFAVIIRPHADLPSFSECLFSCQKKCRNKNTPKAAFLQAHLGVHLSNWSEY